MSETSTPAPWTSTDVFGCVDGKRLQNLYGDTFACCVIDAQGFAVAHCTGPLVTMSSERSEANARLMAAAPDLLACCQYALRHCNPTAGRELEWDRMVEAAIRKATGR